MRPPALRHNKHEFGQQQFLAEIFVRKFSVLEKLLYRIEILAGIEIAESEFADRRQRPLFHAAEEIDEVPIEIVYRFLLLNAY